MEELVYADRSPSETGSTEYMWSEESELELIREEMRQMRMEMTELKQQRCLRLISEKEAEEEIKCLIASWKEHGRTKFNILDMVAETGIDAEIIEKVLEKLEGKAVREEK